MPRLSHVRAAIFCSLFMLLMTSSTQLSRLCSLGEAITSGGGHGHPQVDPGKKLRQDILRSVLLDHFCLGVDAPKEWQDDVRKTSGATFDFMLMYVSGGVGHGESQPFFMTYGSLARRMEECRANHMAAWFTWYMLSQSMPADWKPGPKEASPANAKVASTMHDYFEWFKLAMIELNKYPDVPAVMQIEPDEWNHLLISGHMDPAAVEVKVGSCGQEDLAGLPDNQIGWAQAFGVLRDKYAPRVLLSCNPSGWDWQNTMSGTNMGNTFKLMCGDAFEFATFETGDRDKGMPGTVPPYGDIAGICGTFPDHLAWIRDFHKASELWVACWQVAMGNTYFATCNNTPHHYCDNLAQFILEDYPKNDGIARYVAAGCCGFMFNGCIPGCTNAFDQAADGITDPAPIAGNEGHHAEYPDDDGGFLRIFAGKYYQHPYPIFGSVVHKPSAAERPRTIRVEPTTHSAMLIDPSAEALYSTALRTRIASEMQANRPPSFHCSMFSATVRLASLGEDQLTLATEDGGHIHLAWTSLRPPDLAALALSEIRQGHPEDHAVAAFFLLRCGDIVSANAQLRQSGSGEAAVRSAFTIK